MRKSEFLNEKALQKACGLKYLPDRYSGLDRAKTALRQYVGSNMIVAVDEGKKFKAGYYIVCPADASRLARAGFRIVSPFGFR